MNPTPVNNTSDSAISKNLHIEMDYNNDDNGLDEDLTKSLHIEMDPKKIEVKETPTKVFIGKDNWRKFVVGIAITTLLMTLFLFTYIIMYFIDEKLFKKMFKGYSRPLNGFDITSYVVFVICFTVPSVLPHLSRKLAILIMIPITICFAYTPAYLIRLSIKERFNFSEMLITGYTVYVCAVAGLFVNIMMTKEKFKTDNGIIISTSLCAVAIVAYVYILNLYNPYKWKLCLIVASCAAYAAYLNWDIRFMIKKRSDYYLNGDWFLGFIHLHTDIFFRFWRDMFRPDSNVINTTLITETGNIKQSNPVSVDYNVGDIKIDGLNDSDLKTVDSERSSQRNSFKPEI